MEPASCAIAEMRSTIFAPPARANSNEHMPSRPARMIKYDHDCQVDLRTIGASFASTSDSQEYWESG